MLRSLSHALRRRSVGFLFAFASSIGGAVSPASACSVCLPGDPIHSSHGTTAQSAGDVSLYLEGRAWRKTSGVLPGAHGPDDHDHESPVKEHNSGRRLDLYASWTPIDRLTLTVDLPWVWNRITEVGGDGAKDTSRLSGFGDLVVQLSAVLWRDREVLPATWVEARAFAKFPTGDSNRSVNGVREPHLQVGTGSYDFGLGAAWVHRLDWASLYTSASYRINREGSLDYEYGDVVLANAAVVVPLGHATGVPALDRFAPGLELNYRWADFDEFRGERYRDSGGSILYVTPSLRIGLPWPCEGRAPALRLGAQLPATSRWLHHYQKERPVWFAGLQYGF